MGKVKTCLSLDNVTYALLKRLAKDYHVSVSSLVSYMVWDLKYRKYVLEDGKNA